MPLVRGILDHPQQDRFDHLTFNRGLEAAGFTLVGSSAPTRYYGFHVARRPR